MTTRYICDASDCGKVADPPFTLDYPVTDVDDDGDPIEWSDEAHFCSPSCLASWAMSRALEDADA